MDVNGCDECGLYNGPIFKFETEKERISILTEYNIGMGYFSYNIQTLLWIVMLTYRSNV